MLDVESFLRDRYPKLWQQRPLAARSLSRILRLLFHEREFQQFATRQPRTRGLAFARQVLAYFDFSYRVKAGDPRRIPVAGPLVVVANHPIGSLDGLALLTLIGTVRADVRVVANDMLNAIAPLRELLLPIDNMKGKTRRENLEAIIGHVRDRGGALLIFPAGEVSRLGLNGVSDGKWKAGFLRIAIACHAPVLPIHVDARNSAFFYALSFLARPLSTLWLVREMFGHNGNRVDIRIGEPVADEACRQLPGPAKHRAQLFRRHVYRIGKDKSALLPTRADIADPEDRAQLCAEIRQCEMLGQLPGSSGAAMKIYLYQHRAGSSVMREIGRLRELSFRAVGEGSGRAADIDFYDQHYSHLLLWDEVAMAIVGAYRLCGTGQSAAGPGDRPLYSATLFRYAPAMTDYLAQGLELGRSFVQPGYWGRRSLDYLWFGIGAFLRRNPQYRYLFGPVSLSAATPRRGAEMLVHFYSSHFSAPRHLADPYLPFCIPERRRRELRQQFPGTDYRAEFALLKQSLAHMNTAVPTLWKQYADLCDDGGVQFAAFSIDPKFSHCIDGLILVDSHRLKPEKRARYLGC